MSADITDQLREYLDVLDRSIGELTEVRYSIAQHLLAAEAAQRDPNPKRSPLGDRRERSVPCSVCGAGTWNLTARCDRHLAGVGARA